MPSLRRLILLVLFGLLVSQTAVAQYQTTAISGYRYDQFSSNDTASIDLYKGRGTHFAILVFLPVDANSLPAAELGSDGLVRMYYTRDRLADLIDQLRHESPLKLNYWTGPEDNSHLGTGSIEPVGEGE